MNYVLVYEKFKLDLPVEYELEVCSSIAHVMWLLKTCEIANAIQFNNSVLFILSISFKTKNIIYQNCPKIGE
jgi:hypothetical protein